jgi:hypothetical protein
MSAKSKPRKLLQLPFDEVAREARGYGPQLLRARARLKCTQCGARMPHVQVFRVAM